MKTTASQKDVQTVFEALSERFPNHDTELLYETPFQLLVAVILSAQCTDARVNQTTPALFARFPDAASLARSDSSEVETLIHSCGFFRAKAKAIRETSRDIVEKFDGEVPSTMEGLTSLRGVGRKTASVVLSQAFGVPAIAVDTHVRRVSQRLGWAREDDPVKIEKELCALVPKPLWSSVNGLLILHGRRTCNSRKPLCNDCVVSAQCEFFRKRRLIDSDAAESAPTPRSRRQPSSSGKSRKSSKRPSAR